MNKDKDNKSTPSSEVLINSRTRAAVERNSEKELPPTLDELVDKGRLSIGKVLKKLDENEKRPWIKCWRYTARDGFQTVSDEKGGH